MRRRVVIQDAGKDEDGERLPSPSLLMSTHVGLDYLCRLARPAGLDWTYAFDLNSCEQRGGVLAAHRHNAFLQLPTRTIVSLCFTDPVLACLCVSNRTSLTHIPCPPLLNSWGCFRCLVPSLPHEFSLVEHWAVYSQQSPTPRVGADKDKLWKRTEHSRSGSITMTNWWHGSDWIHMRIVDPWLTGWL